VQNGPSPTTLSLWLPVALYMAALLRFIALESAGAVGSARLLSLHEAAYAGLTLVTIRALARRTVGGVTARRWRARGSSPWFTA
jgi:hypothetical protein